MGELKKEFIPYEQSLALKQLGFDESCFGYYVDGELRGINLGMEELGGVEPYYQRFGFHTLSNHDIDNPNKIVATAPTFSQAFRWFRDKYLLEGLILPQVQSILAPTPAYFIAVISYKDEKWEEKFNSSNDKDEKNFLHYGTYEEAELACLRKLIEIVKTK
jgi:hypothetical protein